MMSKYIYLQVSLIFGGKTNESQKNALDIDRVTNRVRLVCIGLAICSRNVGHDVRPS